MFQAPSSSQGMGAGLQSLTVTEDPWNSLLFSIDKLAFCSSLFNCSGLSPSSTTGTVQYACHSLAMDCDGFGWFDSELFSLMKLPLSLSLSMLRQFPCPSSLSTAAPLDLDQQLSLAMPRAELPTTRAKMLSLVATGSSSLGRTLLRWFAQHWEAGLICTSGCAKASQAKAQTPFLILFSLRWCTSFGLNIPRFSTGGHRGVWTWSQLDGRLPPDPKREAARRPRRMGKRARWWCLHSCTAAQLVAKGAQIEQCYRLHGFQHAFPIPAHCKSGCHETKDHKCLESLEQASCWV